MVTMITPVYSKKYAYKKLFVIMLFCCFLPFILLYAETSTSDEADWSETEWDADELFIPIEQFAGRPVVDMAGILTLNEQQEIAARFTEFSESLKTDASVVLVPDTGDLTAEAYADDFSSSIDDLLNALSEEQCTTIRTENFFSTSTALLHKKRP